MNAAKPTAATISGAPGKWGWALACPPQALTKRSQRTPDLGSNVRGVIERKFPFHSLHGRFVGTWLRQTLLRDPAYPRNTVFSLYYDTPDLALYQQSYKGFYARSKVRLRWYSDSVQSGTGSLGCFLELKSKNGRMRTKHRTPVEIEQSRLNDIHFRDTVLLDLPSLLPSERPALRGPLVPVMLIQYDRWRFRDVLTGSRVSVDLDIRCHKANPSYFGGTAAPPLVFGVVEVKNQGAVFPPALRGIEPLLENSSFSKYSRCCELLLRR